MRAACVFIVMVLASVPAWAVKPKSRPSASEESASAANEAGAEKIAQQIRPSLVKITQLGREGVEGLGSGFVISKDGLIATNLHVVGQGRRLQVQLSDGRSFEVKEVHASDYHLDLAVIRVDAADLKPLALGDSDKVKQGQPIVAMGNPQGLEYSVTQGVVSAVREIEDRPMIQVALPIERGNSGGPLLDRQGRVLGILTLKSMRTENLGFAGPVNDLKTLLAKPNTVPMERWLTIGVLDPRLWKTSMGSRWTQHAGVLKSEQAGDGFGGRTHCVSKTDAPQMPYEVAASVKLDDEAGAAGLIFCCDDSNRCYGFYPTGGQLRLTRFDGPDVFSWSIFGTVDLPAYRAGDWNSLRVRVEADRITCFVNGTQVFDQKDDTFRDGHAGLCKFRSPGAEFRSFRIGADLRDKPIEPEVAERVGKALDGFLTQPHQSGGTGATIEKLLTDRGPSRRVLSDKVRELDAQAAALKQKAANLRKLSTEFSQRAVAEDLGKLMAKPDEEIDLLQAALLVSKHDNPELDMTIYHRMLDRMAAELKDDKEIKLGGEAAVKRLNRYLFEDNGFHGSRFDYDNQSNSYVSDVLENREGIPISLSIVFMEMAARLGLKEVRGMSVPYRFMVGYKAGPDEMGWKFNDVFDGGKLLTAEQASHVAAGGDADFDAGDIRPATKREIIVRMIRNLMANVQGEAMVPPKDAIPYLGLLIALEPDQMGHRFQRAFARNESRDLAGAREDLRAILDHPPSTIDDDQLRELHTMYQSLGDQIDRQNSGQGQPFFK